MTDPSQAPSAKPLVADELHRETAEIAAPIEPVIPGDLTLYDGPIRAHLPAGEIDGTGQIWLRTVADLDVLWAFTHTGSSARRRDAFDLGDVTLTIEHPDLGSTTLDALVTHSSGAGYVQYANLLRLASAGADPRTPDPGQVEDIEADVALDHVDVHWFGLPAILPAGPLRSGRSTYGGRWAWVCHGWQMTFDQRPASETAEPTTESDRRSSDPTTRVAERTQHAARGGRGGPIPMTHVARLQRLEGTFTTTQASDALEIWGTALSFALGRWVLPAIPIGYDGAGGRVWEEWANYRCTPPAANFNWWDNYRSDDLGQIATLLFDAADHTALFTTLRHAIHHAVSASSDRTTLEARVMLAQAGCEYLSWVLHAPTGAAARKVYKQAGAAANLTRALNIASIPTALPVDLPAIAALAPADKQTGPEAVTWLRNKLVHPKDPAEPYRIEHALSDCWLLLTEYLDLLILHTAGYDGHYLPHRSGGWAHNTVPVPWSSDPPFGTTRGVDGADNHDKAKVE